VAPLTAVKDRPALRPLVIAHRGNSRDTPEQTLAAFRRAVELGADMIEADVRRTRDGQLVMFHDPTLERTTNGDGFVSNHAFDELRRLDAGGWFSASFAGERIPSLDELFELAGQERIRLCLEVKGESAAERASVACAVARAIEQRGRLGQDVLASFDHQALVTAAGSTSGLVIAPERLPERGPSDGRAVVEQARSLGAPIIQHHHADLRASTTTQAHTVGLHVWAWPPKARREIERLLAMNVDGIMGGDVEAIRSAL
jgi:glycerophosphoryl diester phosphodiesterase